MYILKIDIDNQVYLEKNEKKSWLIYNLLFGCFKDYDTNSIVTIYGHGTYCVLPH